MTPGQKDKLLKLIRQYGYLCWARNSNPDRLEEAISAEEAVNNFIENIPETKE